MVDEKILEKTTAQLVSLYSSVGQAKLEHKSKQVEITVKSLINENAKNVLKMWDVHPSIAGTVKVEKPLPVASDRSVIAVVIEGCPSISDVYDLKSYAEVITPDYAFLISTKPFEEDLHVYLEEELHILKYLTKGTSILSGTKPIIILYRDKSGELTIDKELSVGDPFDPRHMWS